MNNKSKKGFVTTYGLSGSFFLTNRNFKVWTGYLGKDLRLPNRFNTYRGTGLLAHHTSPEVVVPLEFING